MPRSSVATRLFLLVTLLLTSACQLNRVGIPAGPPGRFEAQPQLACPGDTVTLSWDLQRRREQGFCQFPNGNTPSVQRCETSRQCPDDGRCIDNECNRCGLLGSERASSAECSIPSSAGCLPNVTARLEVEPPPDPPLENATGITNEHRGERQFIIQRTSRVRFFNDIIDPQGIRAGTTNAMSRYDAQLTIEVVDPDLQRPIPNTYECQGRPLWLSTDLEAMFPNASSSLRIMQLHNPNAFAVVTVGFSSEPLELAPNERRSVNLPLRGLVLAQPVQEHLNTLPPVVCSPTRQEGSYPSAPLNLLIACPAEEP